jgi:hypothetical protein
VSGRFAPLRTRLLDLLGGDLGILSWRRDGFRPNAAAARRISPRLLCEPLAFTAPRVEARFAVGAGIRTVRAIVYDRGPDLAGSLTVPAAGK